MEFEPSALDMTFSRCFSFFLLRLYVVQLSKWCFNIILDVLGVLPQQLIIVLSRPHGICSRPLSWLCQLFSSCCFLLVNPSPSGNRLWSFRSNTSWTILGSMFNHPTFPSTCLICLLLLLSIYLPSPLHTWLQWKYTSKITNIHKPHFQREIQQAYNAILSQSTPQLLTHNHSQRQSASHNKHTFTYYHSLLLCLTISLE